MSTTYASHFIPWLISLYGLSFGVIAGPLNIAVDVGHGNKDGGAISARGWSEFDFNRILAWRLVEALRERELGVRQINFDGNIASLAERPMQASGTDLFVSIHHDSIDEAHLQPWLWNGEIQHHTDAKRGYGIFISANNPALETSLRCAIAIGKSLRDAGFEPTTWHGRKHLAADAENGIWYYNNLVVLYRTTVPALLFEAGVIKHRAEELELLDPVRQTRMAKAMGSGIAACLPGGT